MNQYVRFGNAVVIQGPKEAYETSTDPRANEEARWSVSAKVQSGGKTLTVVSPYSPLPANWVVVDPSNKAANSRVKFGNTISLYSLSADGYFSLEFNEVNGQKIPVAGLNPALGEFQQCEILKHGDADSRDEVRLGDNIILKFKDGFCLSWETAPALANLGQAPLTFANRMTRSEKWVLGPVDLLPEDIKNFGALMKTPENRGRILLTQGLSTQQIVAKVAGLAPKVGSGIAALIEVLIPTDGPDLWDMIKDQVVSVVKDLIFEDNLDKFRKELEAAKLNFKSYLHAPRITEKGDWLIAVLASLTKFKVDFYKGERPERTLPYLLATGTLHIVALRERYLQGDTLFPKSAGDDETTNQKEVHLQDLQEAIEFYTEAVKKAKANILEARRKLMKYGHQQLPGMVVFSFKDAGTNLTKSWKPAPVGDKNQEDTRKEAETWIAIYKAGVLDPIAAQIESFIEPMYAWRYLDPEIKELPQATKRSITFGPFGGSGGGEFRDDPKGAKITNIAMRAGEFVDGLEFSYGGKPSGWHGGSGGGLMNEALRPGEKITEVYGKAGEFIDALHIVTNQRTIVGGGGKGGNDFRVKIPEAAAPVLVKISGRAGGMLDSVSFHWEYTRFE